MWLNFEIMKLQDLQQENQSAKSHYSNHDDYHPYFNPFAT